jgi:hypothetical protein
MFSQCIVIPPIVLFFTFMSCVGFQTQPVPAAESPSITLDDAHDQAAGQDATYTIPASSALVVDAGAYKVKVPAQLAVDAPNALHVIHGKAEHYRLSWNGRGKIVLDSKTLEPVKGPNQFPGFKAGEKYIIGIGYDRILGPDKKLKFDILWAAIVEVR